MDNSTFSRPPRRKRFFFGFFFLAGIALLGAVVMYLWNAILPEVAGLKPLGYWQALGLLLLCRILFGGFRFGPRGHHQRPPFARGAFREKFKNMSAEEREAFKARWKEKCKN